MIYTFLPFQQDGTNTKKGLGTVSAGLFIIGEVAGTGLLALPSAIDDTGNAMTKECLFDYTMSYR